MTDPTQTLRMVRSFRAPPSEVWRPWIEPETLARWWWPERFATTYEVDLRLSLP